MRLGKNSEGPMTNPSSRSFFGSWLARIFQWHWPGQDNPLIAYDLKFDRREGRRPWAMVIVANLTLMSLGLYLLALLLAETATIPPLLDFFGIILAFLMTGGGVMVMFGHWRLILAISSRTAAAIAGRKRNGDWDLIAITPMPKSRWLWSQQVIVMWQVFPVLRQLFILQTAMSVVGLGFLTYMLSTFDEGSSWGDDVYLAPWLYFLLMLPVFAFFIAEPFITAHSFIRLGLYCSSLSGRVSTSMLGHFFAICFQRVVMSASFIYGGLFWILLFGGLANGLGLTDDFDTDFNLGDLLGTLAILCTLGFLYVLMLAPVAEWLPLFGALLMLGELEPAAHGVIYLAGIITCLQTYLLLPHLLNKTLYRWTVGRLEQRSLN
jgi:hypothetical protein